MRAAWWIFIGKHEVVYSTPHRSWAQIFKLSRGPRNRFPGTNSARWCSLAGRCVDNSIPTRFLAPIDCLKIQFVSYNDQRVLEAIYVFGVTSLWLVLVQCLFCWVCLYIREVAFYMLQSLQHLQIGTVVCYLTKKFVCKEVQLTTLCFSTVYT